ncbi:3-methyladenine DNA glycosylase [Amylibacter marinus]|uniref:3-methyladenine DNA glycosylase n=1 Tax=Amylibacter marinus TaxID=1475483 RepID=A0ABQ5VUG2_9RHOB|nr:DNA-3-methyladenine glycosylase I [Amylibacter marinus]GLQ35041.1 3-methyladenine DNA glycosylase [Amylibacter marinus]
MPISSFASIAARANDNKNGALEALLADSPPAQDISALTDDRILSEFSKRVFQAGFNWSVVENKWQGFEAAFHQFDLGRNAMMNDEDLDRHLKNTDIIRHATKILSVRDNAIFLSDLAHTHGSAARCIADWPSEDLVGLWQMMKARGARLGGVTGQYALRFMGKDTFILSSDVVHALTSAGVIDGPATSKRAQAKIQAAFNQWAQESGQSLTRISRTLAFSV